MKSQDSEERRNHGSSGLEPTADRVSGFQLHCLRAPHKISSSVLCKRSQRNSHIQQNPEQGQKTEGEKAGLAQHGLQAPPRTPLAPAVQVAPRLSQEHRIVLQGREGLSVGR